MSDVVQGYQQTIEPFIIEAERWDDGLVTWDITKKYPIERGKQFSPETCRRFAHTIGVAGGDCFGLKIVRHGEADDLKQARKDIRAAMDQLEKEQEESKQSRR